MKSEETRWSTMVILACFRIGRVGFPVIIKVKSLLIIHAYTVLVPTVQVHWENDQRFSILLIYRMNYRMSGGNILPYTKLRAA